MSLVPSPLLYFGKLPSRGDFVRSTHGPVLLQVFDRWLSGGMELIAADARWKTLYDRAEPARFAFLGNRQTRGLVGQWMVSQDASGRRFPFIVAATLECTDPLAFLARAPMALARPWAHLQRHGAQAHAAVDATPLLVSWADSTVAVEGDAAAYDTTFDDFCEMQTVGTLQAMLTDAGHSVDVRQLVLGLGLLLQPVLASGETHLELGLLLPLPAEPLVQPLVGALWLDLLAGFLGRAAFELSIFMQHSSDGAPPTMALGFEGNSPRSLHALLDPQQVAQTYVDARQAEWVEESIGHDYGVQKLSSYLLQHGLSLQQAGKTFKETFLGS
ncbi:MAG: type VI secretion system-associated protein TagF [Rubrivivax sp.]|nr:type VI secretion system-associated protein TagF [Rubrivivax sp.]